MSTETRDRRILDGFDWSRWNHVRRRRKRRSHMAAEKRALWSGSHHTTEVKLVEYAILAFRRSFGPVGRLLSFLPDRLWNGVLDFSNCVRVNIYILCLFPRFILQCRRRCFMTILIRSVIWHRRRFKTVRATRKSKVIVGPYKLLDTDEWTEAQKKWPGTNINSSDYVSFKS